MTQLDFSLVRLQNILEKKDCICIITQKKWK